MDHNLIMKTIAIIVFSLVVPTISTRIVSPSPSASPFEFDTLANLMCARYDPKATPESIKNDPAIKDICDTTVKPAECLDFLGNSPKANPAYAIQEDVSKLRRFILEASQQASTDPPPEVKNSFDTCTQNFNEVVNRLDDVKQYCIVCTQHDGKCPTEEANKITTALNSALSNLGLCDKALATTTSTVTKTIKNVNTGVTDSINKILEVSKKLSQ
ncbi:hypothetical protein LINPERPRIM_LOCUS11407 [Linum perenne]